MPDCIFHPAYKDGSTKANQADHDFIVVHEYFPNAVNPDDAIAYQNRIAKDFPKENQAANTIDPASLKPYEQYLRENRDENESGLKDKYIFTETIPLKNLTPNVYYKVRTYDRNHNRSEYSETFELVKKDIVPPPKSVFKTAKTSLSGVDITFAKAKAKDFNRVELSRKSPNSRKWEVIHTLNKESNKEDIVRYRDQKIEPGQEYIYRLQTIDDNGLRSPFAFSSKVKTINRIKVQEINQVNAQRSKDKVKVTWGSERSKDMYFIVYRSTGKGGLKQVGRSEGNTFTDARPPKGQVSYAIKPMRKDENRGKISETVVAR